MDDPATVTDNQLRGYVLLTFYQNCEFSGSGSHAGSAYWDLISIAARRRGSGYQTQHRVSKAR